MNNLQHMYQAWQQGNNDYVRDWARFVEMAATQTNTRADVIMRELQAAEWFRWVAEE
jgi:hypothetical protein